MWNPLEGRKVLLDPHDVHLIGVWWVDAEYLAADVDGEGGGESRRNGVAGVLMLHLLKKNFFVEARLLMTVSKFYYFLPSFAIFTNLLSSQNLLPNLLRSGSFTRNNSSG